MKKKNIQSDRRQKAERMKYIRESTREMGKQEDEKGEKKIK